MTYIQKGTALFRKVNLALFTAGYTISSVLYGIQAIMPELSKDFHISPTIASFSLSGTTIALAVSMLPVASLSEVRGRKPVMTFCLFSVSILTFLITFVPNFQALVVLRILTGIFLAGLQAIAMAYIGEEIEPTSLGVAMGIYVSGTTVGGLSSHIILGMLTDFFSWRLAFGCIGVLSIVISFFFWYTLPPSKNFHSRSLEVGKLVKSMLSHLKGRGLRYLYCFGFLLAGSFVSLFNYISYLLTAPPYLLSQAVVSWIFIVYIAGTFSSTWMGRLADKYGLRKVLWVAILIQLTGRSLL